MMVAGSGRAGGGDTTVSGAGGAETASGLGLASARDVAARAMTTGSVVSSSSAGCGSAPWRPSACRSVTSRSSSDAEVGRKEAVPGGVTRARSAAHLRHPSAWRRSRWASTVGRSPAASSRAVFSSKQDTAGMFPHAVCP